MANSDKIKTIDGFAYWIENEENGVCYIPLNLCEKVMKLLKEQEEKEQCLKTKCVICPHCDNCDVDENGMLKEQEPVYDSYCKLRCGTCRALVNSNDKFCSACGKKIKWKQDNGAINDKV